MRTSLAAGLALVLTFGCADQLTTPTALNEAAPAPAFNFLNNPDNGNARIFRFEQHVFFLIFQFPDAAPPAGTPDLVAVHTTTPDCGGILEPADLQAVLEDPDDPFFNQVRQVTLADPINIFIVDLSQAGSCFGLELVASGTGKLVDTDNDLFIFLRDSNNANAFGFTAQGQLYSPAGQIAHYNGVSKISWDGNTGARFFVNEHFNFKWIGS